MESEGLKTSLKESISTYSLSEAVKVETNEAKFQLKEDRVPVFKKKLNVSLASVEQIDNGFDRLVDTG